MQRQAKREMGELAMSELPSPGIWQAIFATLWPAVVYLALSCPMAMTGRVL
jgi:hypothetical protein